MKMVLGVKHIVTNAEEEENNRCVEGNKLN
jgi:hypothetical protein